jgi:hypothetical protein
MKNDTYPLAMPSDLLGEVRRTARETGLSMADTMRQSIKLGLPKLKERLAAGPVAKLKPFTKEEANQCWGKGSMHELDALEHYCANLPVPKPDEE